MRADDDVPRVAASITRRRLLAAASAAAVGAVAGCSGSDGTDPGGDEDDDDGNGDEPGTGTDGTGADGDGETGTRSPTAGGGEVSASGTLESTVDGLELVDGRYTDTGIEGRFPVTVTVENTGGQETNVEEYSYEYAIYDAGGNDLTGGTGGPSVENPTLPPGETVEALLTAIVEGDPEDVASYEVTLTCASTFDEGVYCESDS